MNFEWDEEKNRANILKHGFDFTDARQAFERPMLTALDTAKITAKIAGSVSDSCMSKLSPSSSPKATT